MDENDDYVVAYDSMPYEEEMMKKKCDQ